jgi:HlyD family secretion protein
MRKAVIILVAVVVVTGGIYYYKRGAAASPAAANGGGPGGMGGPGGGRPPMSVAAEQARLEAVTEDIQIVGNLVGNATVQVVPKVAGRLESVRARIGDTVSRGQIIATVEDNEIREQVRQAEAAAEVSQATIRQRQADLKFAQTNLDRARSLFERQLVARQALDDADARQQAAAAQLELAQAQNAQSRSRLQELRITLENTSIRSPVDGFVGARFLDQGGFASTNQPVFSVVDIRPVRLEASLVERDFRRVGAGTNAVVEVDAFPGEQFTGVVARVAPVFDPQTRTAQMEVEVPNPTGRLKPGMYARVSLRVGEKANALTVPRNAVVSRGTDQVVYVIDGTAVRQRKVELGIQAADRVEVTAGLREGERIVTTGAAALQDGDRIVLPGQAPPRGAVAGTGRGQ